MTKTKIDTNIQKQKKGLTVIGNPIVNKFISSSPPTHLRSSHYSLQAALGIAGILLIFISFKMPILFFIGVLLLYMRRKWRLKTDGHAINYRNAITALKKKKYTECIQNLNKLPYTSNSMSYLDLVKASCFLELEDLESAYKMYKNYFERTPTPLWSDPLYWSARENAVVLSLEHENLELAKRILNEPTEHLTENKKTIRWKNKYAKYVDES